VAPQNINRPESYVFIITYGRSGSTVLQNLLNSLDGYLIRGENDNTAYHLARAWITVKNSKEMSKRRELGRPTDPKDPWFGSELALPKELGQSLADTLVDTMLKPQPDTRVSGFKEIRYHRDPEYFEGYLNFLANFFPNAKLVFNTRNLEDVVKSGWWATVDKKTAMVNLSSANKLYRDYTQKYAKRCYSLRYEDYVQEPLTLRGFFEFLGEPFDIDHVKSIINVRLNHLKK